MITATLVIYNGSYKIIEETISSFQRQNLNSYLIIINNASPHNDLITSLKSYIADKESLEMISLAINKGFGGGHNSGLSYLQEKKIKSDYHLILNPDVIIHENCLLSMVNFMEDNTEVGLCVPKILNTDGTIQYLNKEYPAFIDLFARRFLPSFMHSLSFMRKRHARYIRLAQGYDKIVDVPFASGCFMFFKTKILLKLGGFDERYFMYMEDVDISRRCHDIAEVKFLPGAIITHYWARANHSSIKMTWIMMKSVLKYFMKFGFKLW